MQKHDTRLGTATELPLHPQDETECRSHDVQYAFHCHRPVRWRGWYAAIVVGSHAASPQDFAHDGGDTIDLGIGHAGKQRQRDRAGEIAACDGELA